MRGPVGPPPPPHYLYGTTLYGIPRSSIFSFTSESIPHVNLILPCSHGITTQSGTAETVKRPWAWHNTLLLATWPLWVVSFSWAFVSCTQAENSCFTHTLWGRYEAEWGACLKGLAFHRERCYRNTEGYKDFRKREWCGPFISLGGQEMEEPDLCPWPVLS